MFEKECPVCGGEGECVTSHRWKCFDCDGKGIIDDEKKYQQLVEKEQKVSRERDARLTAWEYRQMGG